jgi:hypothetical protein
MEQNPDADGSNKQLKTATDVHDKNIKNTEKAVKNTENVSVNSGKISPILEIVATASVNDLTREADDQQTNSESLVDVPQAKNESLSKKTSALEEPTGKSVPNFIATTKIGNNYGANQSFKFPILR